jgi:hypothetical protein
VSHCHRKSSQFFFILSGKAADQGNVDQGACRKRGREHWNMTSTLIYGKSEAILVDCQFRISQAKKLADQILNAWEAGRLAKDCRLPLQDFCNSHRVVALVVESLNERSLGEDECSFTGDEKLFGSPDKINGPPAS